MQLQEGLIQLWEKLYCFKSWVKVGNWEREKLFFFWPGKWADIDEYKFYNGFLNSKQSASNLGACAKPCWTRTTGHCQLFSYISRATCAKARINHYNLHFCFNWVFFFNLWACWATIQNWVKCWKSVLGCPAPVTFSQWVNLNSHLRFRTCSAPPILGLSSSMRTFPIYWIMIYLQIEQFKFKWVVLPASTLPGDYNPFIQDMRV